MLEKDIIQKNFNCYKANETVMITQEVSIHRSSSTGEIDMQKNTSFDCSHAVTCGIGKTSGKTTNYDWSKCIYPK